MTPWILWASMGMSQLVLLAVSYVVDAPAGDPSLGPLLILPGLLTALASIALPLVAAIVPISPQPRFLLRCALAEGAGLMGFVSYMLSGDHTWQLVAAGAGLFAWLVAAPLGLAWTPQHRD